MENKEFRLLVEAKAKDTIGYKEAENKDNFMVGVSVALSFAFEKYEPIIANLKSSQANCETEQLEALEMDFAKWTHVNDWSYLPNMDRYVNVDDTVYKTAKELYGIYLEEIRHKRSPG